MDRSFHGDGDGDDVMLVDDYVFINPGSSCHGTTINETPEITHADSADKLPQQPTCLSAETIGEIPSTETSSPSDSMQQQHKAPTAPDLNTNNPSVSTTPLADKSILDRFAQIEMAAILYSLSQNYADKLAAEFLSLMTHERLQPQQKQTMFQQQQQQLQKHHLLQQQKISPSQVTNITNAINLQLRNGSISQAKADAMEEKLKMLHNQTSMLERDQSGITGMTATGHMLERDQSGITGMAATCQMLDGVKSGISDKTVIGKMLVENKSGVTGLTETGQVLEGAGQMLRNTPSSYMNQQQQPQNIILQQRIQQQEQQEKLKQQQRLQLKQKQQQQVKYQERKIKQQRQMERQLLYQRSQQLRQQQQQIGFPLQAVVSSHLVGSPTPDQPRLFQQMSSQLQQFGQQKIIQQTAKSPQLSIGLTPQVNDVAANTMVSPAIPQPSSHSSSRNLVHRNLSNKLQ